MLKCIYSPSKEVIVFGLKILSKELLPLPILAGILTTDTEVPQNMRYISYNRLFMDKKPLLNPKQAIWMPTNWISMQYSAIVSAMLKNIATILEMIKFSHTIFALPFAILGAFMAADGGKSGIPSVGKLILVIMCMVFARSIAMTFNRLVDARIDAQNPRTANRAIPAGLITKAKARWFLGICSIGFVISTSGFALIYHNYYPVIFSIPILIFICSYSFTKRFTWGSHFYLGMALSLAPICAWGAIAPPDGPVLSIKVILLGLAVMSWTAGFDIIYAFNDIDIDQRDKLYSIPSRLGIDKAIIISRVCHILSILILLWFADIAGLRGLFPWAIGLTGLLLTGEHYLVRAGKTTYMKLAFGTLNGIISIILAASAICDIVLDRP